MKFPHTLSKFWNQIPPEFTGNACQSLLRSHKNLNACIYIHKHCYLKHHFASVPETQNIGHRKKPELFFPSGLKLYVLWTYKTSNTSLLFVLIDTQRQTRSKRFILTTKMGTAERDKERWEMGQNKIGKYFTWSQYNEVAAQEHLSPAEMF